MSAEKLTEAEVQWAMKMVDLAGLDPAAGTTLRECAEALLRSDELAERVARAEADLLDEVALRLSRLIPMYTLGMDLTEARAIALHDAIRTVRGLRATTQDGEATC